MDNIVVKGYVFKRWFIYIGWLMLYRPNEPLYYADNAKTTNIHNEYELAHVVFGLSQKRVIRKLSKHLEKYPCGLTDMATGGEIHMYESEGE